MMRKREVMVKMQLGGARNSFVDLWRFIAILMIMGHHQYHIYAQNYPFSYGWIFVEFFFILTGYFTTCHFNGRKEITYEEKCVSAIQYTFYKFKSYLPFIWCAVILEYIIRFADNIFKNGVDIIQIVNSFVDMPLEMLLIGSSYTTPKLVPLWYLSAMFIVFPFFCLLIQCCNKYFLAMISFIVPVLFYGAVGIADNWKFPLNLIRCFSCMLLGVLIFEANNYMLGKIYDFIGEKILAAVQILCVILPVMACYSGAEHVLRLIVLCFVVGIAIATSGKSSLSNIQNKYMLYCGMITMPVYLFHWVVASVVGIFFKDNTQTIRVFLYYLFSVIVGCLAIRVQRQIRLHSNS